MVKNPAGEIAIKWALERRVPQTIKINGTDQYYVFVPQFHVAMSWVKQEHVAQLLAHREKTCNCNNGTYQNAFTYASLLDVCLWHTGDRCKENIDWIEEN